jgi:hypothetical protein
VEWVSAWLMLMMLFAVLLWNGFLTEELSIDSYPRLTIVAMYVTSYVIHFCYTWLVCSSFFTYVAAGASWSLLERARFALGDQKRLRRHSSANPFNFRSIDKANEDHIPTTFKARFIRQPTNDEATLNERNPSQHASGSADTSKFEDDDPRDIKAAISTITKAQNNQRDLAQKASQKALDRVVTNATIMVGITISSGFSSWTSSQFTENSPNNTTTTQIGSLALLGSLSLGVAALFTSAMNLSIVDSAYKEIVYLKEIKINGQAVDHNKKRTSSEDKTPLSFCKGTAPTAPVGFVEILAAGFDRQLGKMCGLLLFGPAYGLLPTRRDNERTSKGTQFDFFVDVRGEKVVLTTRTTDSHSQTSSGENIESINVCYMPRSEAEEISVKPKLDV